MANFTVPNLLGIDWYIENVKAQIYNRICQTWAVDDDSYNSFGRVYRRKTGDGWGFSYYDSEQPNYVGGKDDNNGFLFFEDTLAAVSFFVMNDPVKGGDGGDKVKMQLMFFADLAKITPGGITSAQRLDEVAINDVQRLIKYGAGFTFVVTGQQRGIENVLKGYAGPNKQKNMIFSTDTQIAFAIDLELKYNPSLFMATGQIPAIMPQLIPQSLELYIKANPDLTKLIKVGANKYIQQEYAPCNILIPKLATDGNSFLAGRNVVKPFIFDDGNNPQSTSDGYNGVTGKWDRTGKGTPFGFNDNDTVTITTLVNQY